MQAMMNFIIVFCIIVPLAALIFIIKTFADSRKARNRTQEKLMDIITEYQIKNETRKTDDSEENK